MRRGEIFNSEEEGSVLDRDRIRTVAREYEWKKEREQLLEWDKESGG